MYAIWSAAWFSGSPACPSTRDNSTTQSSISASQASRNRLRAHAVMPPPPAPARSVVEDEVDGFKCGFAVGFDDGLGRADGFEVDQGVGDAFEF